MKKSITILGLNLIMLVTAGTAQAVLPKSEAEIMGAMAGGAWACGAIDDMKTFELISGNILLNKAATKDEQIKAIEAYSLAKITAYRKQKRYPNISCQDFLRDFRKMEIFNSTVYSDGSVKLYDGTMLKSNRGNPDVSVTVNKQ